MVGRRRTTRWWSSQKTLLADPFFLFLSLFLTRKQQQPISTRRRERQIGTRCGKGKKGRKRNRNSIAVERVSQSRCFLSRKEQTSHHRSFLRGGQKSRRHFCLVALDVNSPLSSSVVSLFIPKRRTGAGDIFSRQYRVRSRAARDEENGRRGEGFSSRVWTRLRSGNVELDV